MWSLDGFLGCPFNDGDMPPTIESISPFEVSLGGLVAVLLVALVGLGYYRPSPVALVATVFLAFVVALRGLKPFGDTIAYHLLQAGAFAFWGSIVTATEEQSLISVVFIIVGLIGILYYGRQAIYQGLWVHVE